MSDYKYLGVWIHEFLNHDRTVKALTAAAGRSYGRIINIFKHMGDMGYGTYRTLYNSYVLLVANYAAAVWGFKNYSDPQVLQNKIQRFFLGIHRFAPLPALRIEMDWLGIQMSRSLEMLQYLNRLAYMDEERIPKKILRWDIQMDRKGWIGEVIQICMKLQLPHPIGPSKTLMYYDLEPVQRRMLVKCREEWQDAAL